MADRIPCIKCHHCHITEWRDVEIGIDEPYCTFWCRLLRCPIYEPADTTCARCVAGDAKP